MEKQFIAVIIIFILIAVTVVIFLVKALLKNMEKYRAALETVNNLEQLNARMRSQRHDYINQMQVIYGLLELEEYDEALDYLKPIFTDMMKVGKALKTKIPAVNALLMAKMQTATPRTSSPSPTGWARCSAAATPTAAIGPARLTKRSFPVWPKNSRMPPRS